MATTNVNWEKNIEKAMTEVDGNHGGRLANGGVTLPNWIPYVVCVLFGFLLADVLINDRAVHSVNENRDYNTGGKVALLMVAEDIQSYWDTYGSLPDDVPGSLAQVLDISYEKLSDEHFRLQMSHGSSAIVFDGREDTLEMQ